MNAAANNTPQTPAETPVRYTANFTTAAAANRFARIMRGGGAYVSIRRSRFGACAFGYTFANGAAGDVELRNAAVRACATFRGANVGITEDGTGRLIVPAPRAAVTVPAASVASEPAPGILPGTSDSAYA